MDWAKYKAALFDLDGVLTPTAAVHRKAWSDTFNAFLSGIPGQQPYTDEDYFEYVDGKPRYDGVRDFLASRGIVLPEDGPVAPTVHSVGDGKNAAFNTILARDGVAPYPGSVALLDHLRDVGTAMAVVSSSRNAPAVLRAAGLAEIFPVVVDGATAKSEGLGGKPAPDTFVRAAELLGATPGESVVVEDAISGVAAGAAGGFGLVIGVDRGVGAEALVAAGADVVVADLGELA